MLRVHGSCLRALGLVFVEVAEVLTGTFRRAWGLCKCLLRAYGVMLGALYISDAGGGVSGANFRSKFQGRGWGVSDAREGSF